MEPTLAGDGELATLADWGAKFVGAVARIAGILHLAEHGADTGRGSRSASRRSWPPGGSASTSRPRPSTPSPRWAPTRSPPTRSTCSTECTARPDEVSERDIHMATRSRSRTVTDMRPALTRVVDHGWLIALPTEAPTDKGRPASPPRLQRGGRAGETPWTYVHKSHKAQKCQSVRFVRLVRFVHTPSGGRPASPLAQIECPVRIALSLSMIQPHLLDGGDRPEGYLRELRREPGPPDRPVMAAIAPG